MICQWLKKSPSLTKGITVVNHLEETKFEQFLRRIVAKLKVKDTDIFTEEEQQKLLKIFKVDEENLFLAIKTVIYIFKRILKFIFMPADLKTDLKEVGLTNDKAEVFTKVWSTETQTVLDELSTEIIDDSDESLKFTWKLNAELSSNYHKKCKIPKAYLLLATDKDNTDLELTHSEMYSVFLQFESIQNELDQIL